MDDQAIWTFPIMVGLQVINMQSDIKYGFEVRP